MDLAPGAAGGAQSTLEKLQDTGEGEKWTLMDFLQQCFGGVSAAQGDFPAPELGIKGFPVHSWQFVP